MSEPPPKSARLIDDERKLCPHCGYNLTGQLAADIFRCPECGNRFRYSELLDDSTPDPNAPPDPTGSGGRWYAPAMTLWVISPALVLGIAHTWSSPAFLRTAVLASAPLVLYGWSSALLHNTEFGRRRWAALFPTALACAGNVALSAVFGAFHPYGVPVFMVAVAFASVVGVIYAALHLRR